MGQATMGFWVGLRSCTATVDPSHPTVDCVASSPPSHAPYAPPPSHQQLDAYTRACERTFTSQNMWVSAWFCTLVKLHVSISSQVFSSGSLLNLHSCSSLSLALSLSLYLSLSLSRSYSVDCSLYRPSRHRVSVAIITIAFHSPEYKA